ncbi:hypothetical protein CG51_08490 [Haematobacter missouriensis]|uniref:HlyD family secretion protein n=1 Tax=Haematobacter missouriensis TaxID=366616 RepID=A0A212APM7_9RHOB|nr:HlyD family secretion protein [Haematobacter missouriensis]KFI27819.1 hypothetical protein CG51_08490 [Haematobacter missouriensis]OWJ76002.1 HlyD family secretion protein [Haematobacter missouriensis]OWJ83425.1 HlyD family secretion protein [Haematobacter missouriensis]
MPRDSLQSSNADPAQTDAASTDQKAPPGRKRFILIGLLAVALIALLAFGWHYWTIGRFEVSTDDAYVRVDFAILAPKTAGYVATVPAIANQAVHAGDPLVTLEDGDARDALAQAEAQLAVQQASIQRIESQEAAAATSITQAEAQVTAAEAVSVQAAADLTRYIRLAQTDAASAQRLESARATAATSEASLAEARAGVSAAEANARVVSAQKLEAEAMVPGLTAQRDQAARVLNETVLRAPVDGVVGNLSVAIGDYVTPGKRLMAIVPLRDTYIEANFKETQIEKLLPGTHVRVDVDAYPDRSFDATVIGISPASGAVFSLLPPENATGNFTKVVQRLPVRVQVPDDVAEAGWLRPGMSVVVTADTRTTPPHQD